MKRDAVSTIVAHVDEAKQHACLRLVEILESSDEEQSDIGEDNVDLGTRHTLRLTPQFHLASSLRYNRESFWSVSQSALEQQKVPAHGQNYQTSLLYNVSSKMADGLYNVSLKMADGCMSVSDL